jgi:transposase
LLSLDEGRVPRSEDGVRSSTVVRVLLGVEHTVVESVQAEPAAGGGVVLVVRVRPDRSARSRCSRCGRRARGYDRGDGRRRWRGLDFGTVPVLVEADAPRVSCRVHGVVVAAVPWARARSRFTRDFEDTCAWLAAHAPGSVVAELLRVTWRSVASVVARVVAEVSGRVDRLAGLRRIGIDEIAFRKGHRYLTTVVDHDTGRLVWAAEGRNSQTLGRFFDALGAARAGQLTHVSADGAEWIHTVVRARAPQALLCLDPYHVVAWATTALDEVRRGITAELKATGRTDAAAALTGSRWALVRNPEQLSATQRGTLAAVKDTNRRLYTGYLLKEQMRAVFQAKGEHGRALLAGWLAWARRSRIPAFTKLAKTITRYLPILRNTLDHGLSNARAEATHTHLRVLTRRSYGFHSPEALIAMAMLTRGGLCPPLPGRPTQLST